MPAYDATGFRPPAPVARVILRSQATGYSIANVPMLLDTGADVSLVPRDLLGQLIDSVPDSHQYELEAFDGTRSFAPVANLEFLFLGKSFRGQFLVIEGQHGVLGRNILNAVSLLLDGPALTWNEQR